MLVQIESIQFALFRHAQQAEFVDGQHHCHRDRESCRCDNGAAYELRGQNMAAATVEKSFHGDGIVRTSRT